MTPRSSSRSWCLLLLIGLLAGCAPATAQRAPASVLHPLNSLIDHVPAFKHIFIVVLENKSYEQTLGSQQAPYLNGLAQQYGLATNYYAISHPSLPNYLALTGGSTFGIASDCTNCPVSQPSVADQIEKAGKTWKAYMEDMPGPCFAGDSAPLYRQKHNPFFYYTNVRDDPARCNRIVPFAEFASDIKANTLPNFVWITPNMENDAHDGTLADSDAWLKQWIPQILASPAWRDNGVLFLTFDEGKGDAGCCQEAGGGRVVTVVLSPLGKPGHRSAVKYSHYSLLRTIEDAWGMPALGGAQDSAPMADFFADPAAVKR